MRSVLTPPTITISSISICFRYLFQRVYGRQLSASGIETQGAETACGLWAKPESPAPFIEGGDANQSFRFLLQGSGSGPPGRRPASQL